MAPQARSLAGVAAGVLAFLASLAWAACDTTTTTTTLFALCPPTAELASSCAGGQGVCLPLCQDTCPGSQLACVQPAVCAFGCGVPPAPCATDADCARSELGPYTLCAALYGSDVSVSAACSSCGSGAVKGGDCARPEQP